MRVSRGEEALNYAILTIFALFAIAPIAAIAIAAFGPQIGMPAGFYPGNFADAWTAGGFGSSLLTSLEVAVIVVAVSLAASILAGYAFGTMRFRGATALFLLFMLGLMVPSEAIVIPLFFDMRTLGLTDTMAAVTLPQIAQSIAFGTFWMRAQFRALPPNLIEAAAIDGAGGFRALTRIAAPASLPSIATATVLMFLWTWNEFLIPLVMSPSGAVSTAPLGLAIFKGQYTADSALLSAAGVIIALPVICVLIALQRYFIRGMLEGASKQ